MKVNYLYPIVHHKFTRAQVKLTKAWALVGPGVDTPLPVISKDKQTQNFTNMISTAALSSICSGMLYSVLVPYQIWFVYDLYKVMIWL